MTNGIHAEAESFVERRFAIMTTHSGFLLDDSFLSGHIHHIELHIQVCKTTPKASIKLSSLKSCLKTIYVKTSGKFTSIRQCVCQPYMWPWTTKPIVSHTHIFVSIANNSLYGSKLSIFLLCQKKIKILLSRIQSDEVARRSQEHGTRRQGTSLNTFNY